MSLLSYLTNFVSFPRHPALFYARTDELAKCVSHNANKSERRAPNTFIHLPSTFELRDLSPLWIHDDLETAEISISQPYRTDRSVIASSG